MQQKICLVLWVMIPQWICFLHYKIRKFILFSTHDLYFILNCHSVVTLNILLSLLHAKLTLPLIRFLVIKYFLFAQLELSALGKVLSEGLSSVIQRCHQRFFLWGFLTSRGCEPDFDGSTGLCVRLFSMLFVEASPRALSGNGQCAGGDKKKMGKMFRYAEPLPPCGIHRNSWGTVQLILKQYLAFPTK